MRKIAFFVLLMMAVNVFAQMTTDLPKTLGSTMKAMNADLKKITAQAGDEKKNKESSELTLDLINLTTHSKVFIPKTLKDLPEDQQKIQIEQYNKLVDELVVILHELNTAFVENKNDKTSEIIAKISAARKEGHNQFK